MGAENNVRLRRDFVNRVYKDNAALLEVMNYMLVMNDFVKHVERRAMLLQRTLNRLDRHLHAGAKAARFGQDNFFDRHSVVGESG